MATANLARKTNRRCSEGTSSSRIPTRDHLLGHCIQLKSADARIVPRTMRTILQRATTLSLSEAKVVLVMAASTGSTHVPEDVSAEHQKQSQRHYATGHNEACRRSMEKLCRPLMPVVVAGHWSGREKGYCLGSTSVLATTPLPRTTKSKSRLSGKGLWVVD